jgi:NADPH:quinone reductase-like Zn-dependent oxidoreductase
MSKLLAATSYGRPPALELVERVVPAPGTGQATLRIEAASLNPYDLTLVSGAFDAAGERLPSPMAAEGAGVVTAVGEGAVDATGRESTASNQVCATATEPGPQPAG